MTEAILIEIATRFRALEDALEEADLELVARQYNTETTAEENRIAELRGTVESRAESCRDDMNTMMEFIRGKM